ncbi:D-alanyl-D-alanine carboxypeptidase family protein [Emcibacter sp.]|uniref:D-alanyl-D-alanine carboxypeptidase family protein n=1 Tax=Emcibacter sp. TaxID=1979954 RepID=UPI002AA5EFB2|nr:D-alanyl-D-alanine carboxypeptidase family protein [Emcibacter sp.]
MLRNFGRQLASFGFVLALAGIVAASATAGASAQAIKTVAEEAILIEGSTGAVLFEKEADTQMPPSSMSKLMTVYLAFEKLKDGVITPQDEFEVSEPTYRKWRLQGSTMFLNAGDRVTVHDLLLGIIVQSGNDACVVLAESLAGSEEIFVEWMNAKAKELGMNNSHFTNVNGWPDEDHYMTARDLATLTQAMIANFPEYYPMFAERNFTYAGIPQSNRNPILYSMEEADGLKTGHTEAGGYGLTASAVKGGRRLILVLNGMSSEKVRARESERLLTFGFRNFDIYPLLKAGQVLDKANVWLGETDQVSLVIENDVTLSLSKQARRKMKAKVVYDGPIQAPIVKGQPIATLEITSSDMKTITLPLVAGENISELGGFSRLKAAFNYMLIGSSGQGDD